MQGVNLDRCHGSIEFTDILPDLDVWDPDRALEQLQALVHGLEAQSTPNHLVVIDSLSYISSVFDESCRRVVQLTQALTSMVRFGNCSTCLKPTACTSVLSVLTHLLLSATPCHTALRVNCLQ